MSSKTPSLSAKFNASTESTTLVHQFELEVKRHPDDLAVIDHDLTWSYQELNARSNGIATSLLKIPKNRSRNSAVAVLLDLEADAISSVFGILKAGSFYVPIDPEWPVNRIETILNEIKPFCLIHNDRYAKIVAQLTKSSFETLRSSECSPPANPTPRQSISPEDLAYVMYTSGSTGTPKGVMQNHKSVLFDTLRQGRDLSTEKADRYGLLFPVSSSASCCSIFGALLNGAGLSCFDLHRRPISEIGEWFNRDSISICDINVAALRLFGASMKGNEQFPSMRMIAPGGEPLYKNDVELCRRIFSSKCLVQNSLGTTETRTATQYFIQHSALLSDANVPVGTEVEGKTVLLLDENLHECSQGEIGIRSKYLSPGYWNRPDLTDRAFKTDAPSGETLYLTGDIGKRLENGMILHLGRKDHQVKIRGYRVEIEEIENRLMEFPKVADAAVIAKKDHKEELRLHAFLAYPKAINLEITTLRNWCLNALPNSSVPSHFYRVDELPKTRNGKIARQQLFDIDCIELSEAKPKISSPNTPLESTLLDIFRNVLANNQIGTESNFFELGGDSIRSLECLLIIERETGHRLTPNQFLERPNVNSLSKFLASLANPVEQNGMIQLANPAAINKLYILPGLYGSSEELRKFANLISKDFTVYGVEQTGGISDQSFESIAAQYTHRIISQNQGDEYYLTGYSFGGVLAFEIARQLKAVGKQVNFTGLIDSTPPSHLGGMMNNPLRFLSNLPLWLIDEYKTGNLRNQLDKLFFKIFKIQSNRNVPNSKHYEFRALPEELLKQVETKLRALETYTPAKCDLDLSLFYSQIRPLKHSLAPVRIWSELTIGEVDRYLISGNHETIMTKHLYELVKVYNECLINKLRNDSN